MKVNTISRIGADGHQSITIEDVEPKINEHNLYYGGHFYSFELDHTRQTTKMYEFSYLNGVPRGFDKCLKQWKNEILSESEMLEVVEKLKGKKKEAKNG